MNRRERLPLVRHLDAIGLSMTAIGELVGWGRSVISKDIRALDGDRISAENRPSRDRVFETALRTYAWLSAPETPGQHGFGGSQRADLTRMLAQWLRVEEIVGIVEGIALAHYQLTRPEFPPHRSRTMDLLDAVFGSSSRRPHLSGDHLRTQAMVTWRHLLWCIAAEKFPTPTTREDILVRVAHAAEEWRADVVQSPSDAAFDELDGAIAALPALERRAIRLHFAIDDDAQPHTHHAVARTLGITDTAARALVQSGMQRLRSPQALPLCRTFMQQHGLPPARAAYPRRAARGHYDTRGHRVHDVHL